MRQYYQSLNRILDDEFLQTLAKSADLYKIGSNSVLDPEEIRIGLKVVPRAVMSMLISELVPMEINSHKDIVLPFGKMAKMSVNKNAGDDFTGSVYSDNKLVYDFKNRSIPGLGIILLSTFELYELEQLCSPPPIPINSPVPSEDIDKKIQRLIDERMELHSLVSKVVEEKMSQRDALHKLMMVKLNDALKTQKDIQDVTKVAKDPGNAHADEYMRGMANGLEVANSIASKKEPQFVEPKKAIEIKPSDIIKKESAKKGSPLKDFLDRKSKKLNKKEYHVEIAKSETIHCEDCGQAIFGGAAGYSGCICYGPDQHRKIWLKKTDSGFQLKFSRGWDEDNIAQLLEALRKSNGRN